MSSQRWKKFFVDSGLPSDVAANYVVVFMENRIRFDMLSELNKEILYDMGIRKIGDVISILRHAKEVHNSTSRDKVFSTDTNEPMGTDNTSSKSVSTISVKPTTPVAKTTRVVISSQSGQINANNQPIANVGTRSVQCPKREPVILRNVTGLNTRKRIEPPSDEVPRAKLSRVSFSSSSNVTVRNRIDAQSRRNNFSKEIHKALSSNLGSTTSNINNTNNVVPLLSNQSNTSGNKASVTVHRTIVVTNSQNIKSRLGKTDIKDRLGAKKQTVFDRISSSNKTNDSVFNRLGAR